MLERPAVDAAAAREFLSGRFGTEVSDVVAAPRQGMWTSAYFFGLADGELVLRFADTAWNFEKDRRFSEFAAPDLPIPRMIEIGEVGDGRYYAISERAHGAILEELPADGVTRALPSLFRTLDAMREIDLSDTTGFGAPLPDFDGESPTWRQHLLSVADDQPALVANPVRGWRRLLDRKPDAARTFDDGFAALTAWVDACPEDRHLVHGDLLYGNVLVDDDRVSGIFDWQCALYGDFLHDVALLTFWAPWYPALDGAGVDAAILAHYKEIGLVVPDVTMRLRCYELHIGLAHLGYDAFTQEWDHLEWTERRVRQVLHESP